MFVKYCGQVRHDYDMKRRTTYKSVLGVKHKKIGSGPALSLSSMNIWLHFDRGAWRSRVERKHNGEDAVKVRAESKASSVKMGLEERVMRPAKAPFRAIVTRSYPVFGK